MNGVFQRAHGMSGDVWDAYLWALFLGQEVDAFIVPYMGIMHPVFLQASVHALLIYATSGGRDGCIHSAVQGISPLGMLLRLGTI